MSDTTDRAGESVLGTLLAFYKPELVTIVQARGVTAKDFGMERQEIMFRAILALHRDGVHVDALIVEAFLAKHGCLERAGGVGYVALCEASACPSAFREHAFIVAESGRWRRLLRAQYALVSAIEAQDDGALREAVAAVHRDVLPDEAPKLRIVKGAA